MNGVHDMGGMHGFGPVQPERNEPVFHAPWEGRIYAMVRAMGAWRKWNIDASRHQRELIPPADYLRMSYYEKWLTGLIELMVKQGLVTREEIESGHASPSAAKAQPALTADKVLLMTAKGSPANREVSTAPRFKVGDAIRTRNIHPQGHTRLPRYARARHGTINLVHGAHVFPDSNSAFRGESPQYLYSVRFAAKDLWGEQAASRDGVYLDLWESYLEPAA